MDSKILCIHGSNLIFRFVSMDWLELSSGRRSQLKTPTLEFANFFKKPKDFKIESKQLHWRLYHVKPCEKKYWKKSENPWFYGLKKT
jgi:hypothetical protein